MARSCSPERSETWGMKGSKYLYSSQSPKKFAGKNMFSSFISKTDKNYVKVKKSLEIISRRSLWAQDWEGLSFQTLPRRMPQFCSMRWVHEQWPGATRPDGRVSAQILRLWRQTFLPMTQAGRKISHWESLQKKSLPAEWSSIRWSNWSV